MGLVRTAVACPVRIGLASVTILYLRPTDTYLVLGRHATTYHLPPTTYHLPPTTYHLPPTSYLVSAAILCRSARPSRLLPSPLPSSNLATLVTNSQANLLQQLVPLEAATFSPLPSSNLATLVTNSQANRLQQLVPLEAATFSPLPSSNLATLVTN
jgi:hypothetical protein